MYHSVVVVVVYTETLACVVRPTDSTHQPGKPIFSGRYHRRFLACAEYEVGIREQSPDSRSSLAVLPMYDPEVAGLVDRRRYRSVHCRGGGRQSRRQGPCICGLHPPNRSNVSDKKSRTHTPRRRCMAIQACSPLHHPNWVIREDSRKKYWRSPEGP